MPGAGSDSLVTKSTVSSDAIMVVCLVIVFDPVLGWSHETSQ